MRLIIDASVAVKFIVMEEGSGEALALLTRPAERLAPDWMRLEVANALWKKVHWAGFPQEQARTMFASLPAFIDKFLPAEPLSAEALDLALRLDHPVYDCVYLALAMQERAVLITADHGLYEAALRTGLGDHMELLTWPR